MVAVQPAVSIAVGLAQFSGGTCEDDTFISLIITITAGNVYCSNWDTPVGKSLFVSTYAGDFTCPDGQIIVLKVWQSSKDCKDCAKISDATIGPLATEATDGGCNIMPVRSAQLACQ